MEPVSNLENIKYEPSPTNTVPTYGSHHYYSPFSEWNQPQNYYGQGWPQQPNIHVNYIMNSNVIHNYGAAANTNTSALQPSTNVQSVSIKNYITFGNRNRHSYGWWSYKMADKRGGNCKTNWSSTKVCQMVLYFGKYDVYDNFLFCASLLKFSIFAFCSFLIYRVILFTKICFDDQFVNPLRNKNLTRQILIFGFLITGIPTIQWLSTLDTHHHYHPNTFHHSTQSPRKIDLQKIFKMWMPRVSETPR